MQKSEYDLMYQYEMSFWWHVAKRNYVYAVLTKLNLPTTSKVLDIGCGTGGNYALLSSIGTYSGVDKSPYAINYCRKRHAARVLRGDANKLSFKNNLFDLVTILDVLYHEGINDDAVLKKTYEIIRPGGYVLITDCAHQWLFGPHDTANQARLRYSKKGLEDKVKKAGFSIQKSTYIYCSTFPLFLVDRLLQKYLHSLNLGASRDIQPTLNSIIISALNLEAKWVAKFPLPWGSSVLILAKKHHR